jgi:peptide/nickel transport system substrate-binding protein
MALTIDRQASIDILTEEQGLRAAAMQPPLGGQWGMPAELLAELPGYRPDMAANRAAQREIVRKLGCGPDKRLAHGGRPARPPDRVHLVTAPERAVQ